MRVVALIDLLRSRGLELAYEPSSGRLRDCVPKAFNFSDPGFPGGARSHASVIAHGHPLWPKSDAGLTGAWRPGAPRRFLAFTHARGNFLPVLP